MRAFSLRVRSSQFFCSLAVPALALCANGQDLLSEVAVGMPGDRFGFSVAMDGDFVLAGSPGNDSMGAESGALVLVDARTGELVWQWEDPDGRAGDHLGTAVALGGDLAVVGSPDADDKGFASGAAWIVDMELEAGVMRLSPADGQPGDRFGASVAVATSGIAVGTSRTQGEGAVYLFHPATGQQLARLSSPFYSASNDRFGTSVAINPYRLAVGAYLDGEGVPYSGAVYLYKLNPLALLKKYKANDPQGGSWFGRSMAMTNSRLAVGAPRADGKGAVYVFDLTSGAQVVKISLPGLTANDSFGWIVAFTGTKLLIGAPGDDDEGENAGAIYVIDPAQPASFVKLTPSLLQDREYFGLSVAADGAASSDLYAGSAPQASSEQQGSVFVFTAFDDCNDNIVADDEEIEQGTGVDEDHDGVLDECQCQGASFCQANPNSTGSEALASWSGSLSVAANQLTLEATGCPPAKTGLFYYGTDQLSLPFGNGWRCVGGSVFRLRPFVTNAAGLASQAIDLSDLPAGGDIAADSTWHFQLWYRDPAADGARFNLSNGLTLRFCD